MLEDDKCCLVYLLLCKKNMQIYGIDSNGVGLGRDYLRQSYSYWGSNTKGITGMMEMIQLHKNLGKGGKMFQAGDGKGLQMEMSSVVQTSKKTCGTGLEGVWRRERKLTHHPSYRNL